jgi:hypothetical protein
MATRGTGLLGQAKTEGLGIWLRKFNVGVGNPRTRLDWVLRKENQVDII